MTHVIVPLLVVGILHSVATAPVINCCFVCISVEDVDVAKPSTHFDRAISSTAICALSSITGSLWTRVGANALGAILQACIVIASRGTVSHTPENMARCCRNSVSPNLRFSLPIWCVVPKVVVGPLKEHPVKIIEGVLEASNVGKVGGVVSRVLVEIHCPRSPTAEICISRAGSVAVAAVSYCSGRLIHAKTAISILKPSIGKPSSITGNDASEMKKWT